MTHEIITIVVWFFVGFVWGVTIAIYLEKRRVEKRLTQLVDAYLELSTKAIRSLDAMSSLLKKLVEATKELPVKSPIQIKK